MKATQRTNFRVEVSPDESWEMRQDGRCGETAAIADCDRIAHAVRRHVDGVASAIMRWDIDATCSHCGSRWTEGDAPHNGGCCDADAQVMAAEENA